MKVVPRTSEHCLRPVNMLAAEALHGRWPFLTLKELIVLQLLISVILKL